MINYFGKDWTMESNYRILAKNLPTSYRALGISGGFIGNGHKIHLLFTDMSVKKGGESVIPFRPLFPLFLSFSPGFPLFSSLWFPPLFLISLWFPPLFLYFPLISSISLYYLLRPYSSPFLSFFSLFTSPLSLFPPSEFSLVFPLSSHPMSVTGPTFSQF